MAAATSGTYDTFINQVSFLRGSLDPDMTALAMAIFIEVSKHPAEDGVPMARIVDKFDLSASTCSRNIYLLSSGLVRPGHPRKGLGVVKTDSSPNDRRHLHVYLTTKGQQIAKAFLQVK